MLAVAVSKETFVREVMASEQPVIVDFWAPWCGLCLAVAPLLDRIAAAQDGEIKLVKVNVDTDPELAALFAVSSIPTIMLFKGGVPVAAIVGARSKAQLERALGLS